MTSTCYLIFFYGFNIATYFTKLQYDPPLLWYTASKENTGPYWPLLATIDSAVGVVSPPPASTNASTPPPAIIIPSTPPPSSTLLLPVSVVSATPNNNNYKGGGGKLEETHHSRPWP
jgi:hypothetical protein